MHRVTIENFELVYDDPKTLALFNAHINGILIRRCAIIVTLAGEIVAVPPMTRTDNSSHGIWFVHLDLRDLFRREAMKAFERARGSEPEDAGVLRTLRAETRQDVVAMVG